MIKVNLQPKVKLEIKQGLKLPLWPVIASFIIVILGIGYLYWNTNMRLLELASEEEQLRTRLKSFQGIIEDFNTAQEEKNYLEGKKNFVNSISQNQRQWTDLFDRIREKIPKDVWIDTLKASRDGQYDLDGATFTYSSIGHFMLQLNTIPHILTVQLEQASTSKSSSGGDNTKESMAIAEIAKSFRLTGNMKLTSETTKKTAENPQGGKPAPRQSRTSRTTPPSRVPTPGTGPLPPNNE